MNLMFTGTNQKAFGRQDCFTAISATNGNIERLYIINAMNGIQHAVKIRRMRFTAKSPALASSTSQRM